MLRLESHGGKKEVSEGTADKPPGVPREFYWNHGIPVLEQLENNCAQPKIIQAKQRRGFVHCSEIERSRLESAWIHSAFTALTPAELHGCCCIGIQDIPICDTGISQLYSLKQSIFSSRHLLRALGKKKIHLKSMGSIVLCLLRYLSFFGNCPQKPQNGVS